MERNQIVLYMNVNSYYKIETYKKKPKLLCEIQMD